MHPRRPKPGEPVPDPLPLPSADVPEDEKIPRHWVAGAPLPRRIVLIYAALLGLAFAGTGLGTTYAIHISNNNAKNLETRSTAREKQNHDIQQRLDYQQQQITAQQEQTKGAVCGLVVGIVARDRAQGQNTDPLTIQFAGQYGCIVPPVAGR